MTEGGMFPEWFAAQKAKAAGLPARIQTMHRLYGRTEGQTCKGCKHLLSLDYHSRVYHKCELSKITHGPGTDWRVGWQACGKFEPKEVEAEEGKTA